MTTPNFKEDYPGLSFIYGILKFLGWFIIVISIIGLIGGLSLLGSYNMDETAPFLILGSLLFGLLTSVPLFAFSELIKLFVKIEFNTRKDDYYSKKEINEETSSSTNNRQSFEEWKKNNPSKTIGDYYSHK